MTLQATGLFNSGVDGRMFCSTVHLAGVQIDLSGHWRSQLAVVSSFAKLLRKHQGWLKSNGVPSRYFSREREVEDFRVLRTEHFRAMERAGLFRFTDGSASTFLYTRFRAAMPV